MSNRALDAVFSNSKTRHGARLLMLALADRANDAGVCWPGVKDLRKRTGLSKSAVWEATDRAVRLRELRVEPHAGRNRTHRYTVLILDRSESEPSEIGTDTVQNLDRNGSESGPKPSLTLNNPQSLDRGAKGTEAKRKAKAEPDEDFTAFWAAYPRKVAKPAALRAWSKTAQERPPLPDILTAIERHKRQWHDPKFIPHPASWLNGHRWEDELNTPAPAAGRRSSL
jgi:hypothetical protein